MTVGANNGASCVGLSLSNSPDDDCIHAEQLHLGNSNELISLLIVSDIDRPLNFLDFFRIRTYSQLTLHKDRANTL